MKESSRRLLAAGALTATLAVAASRPIRFSDVPVELRPTLAADEAAFDALVRSLDKRTAGRLRQGELDHLVHYVLQSRRFTREPPIEPALSAKEFVETGKIPAAFERRMADFRRAGRGDERLTYFRKLAPPDLTGEYTRLMRFLYEKEFVAQGLAPEERAAALARLYQQRGHSTDTDPRANLAVAEALGVVKGLAPAIRLRYVLVVGPGLDFAPRTGFRDSAPQSYQPRAVRDTLLRLGLADAGSLRIDCVDVNERVIAHLQAQRLDIITERLEPSPGYDLVVATNVLAYFDPTELLLALVNIHSMMRPEGWLIHNELRAELEPLARGIGLTLVHGRTLRLGPHLLDAAVIHRKQ